VFEARKNLDVCFTNFKNGNIKHFELSFKSKKQNSWSIGIPKSAIKLVNDREIRIYTQTEMHSFRLTEQVSDINHDCNLCFDGIDYYICIPEIKQMKHSRGNWFASLDPGERKFQTLFCPDDNMYIKMGTNASRKIYLLMLKLDNLIGVSASKPSRKIKTCILSLRRKILNLQKELHNKISSYLCNNYTNIYVPKLTKNNNILKINGRTLQTKTVRQMSALGHCKFIEKLKTKAQLFTNVHVRVITEEYSSQKCLGCKLLTKTSNELYQCKHCKYTIDRDILGSTNILLMNW
jgi:transposase